AAHNTVVVDGENSSEVWSGFRVARRARPVDLSIKTGNGVVVECGHDGYYRLPGRPMHRRTWRMRGHRLTVVDMVTGDYSKAEARFHLHPEVAPTALSGRSLELTGAFPGSDVRV